MINHRSKLEFSVDPKIKAARRKHKLRRDLGGSLAIVAMVVFALWVHLVQWSWAMSTRLSQIEACFVIALAWLCVIGLFLVPAGRYLNK